MNAIAEVVPMPPQACPIRWRMVINEGRRRMRRNEHKLRRNPVLGNHRAEFEPVREERGNHRGRYYKNLNGRTR